MSEDKTEQPTARRLRQAREQGDTPVSNVLSQSIGFISAIAILPGAVASAVHTLGGLLTAAVDGRTLTPMEMAVTVLGACAPLLLVPAFAAVAVSFAQSGGVIALGRVMPKLERLDFFQGLKGLFQAARLFGVVRALVSAGLALLITWVVLKAALGDLAHTSGEIGPALELTAAIARRLLWYCALLGLAIGLVDWGIVRRAWMQRWMMTRDEVKREFRESEGDPELKAARRRAHQEALTSNSLFAVRDASVVIVNPTHLATALRYEEEEDAAPRILASGQGDFARRIVEAAHHYGVPVVQDIPVARALAELEVGEEIPESLYEAVAEILKEVWEQG